MSGNKGICKIEIINFFNNNIIYSTNCKIYQQKIPILSFAEGCNWNISVKINLDKLNLSPEMN